MNSNDRIAMLALGIMMAGCAPVPIQQVASYDLPDHYEEVAPKIVELVRSCWSDPGGGLLERDAIFPRVEPSPMYLTVTIGRDNHTIPFIPFARIIVERLQDDSARVRVEHGQFLVGRMMDVNRSVREWLGGDESCRDRKYTDYQYRTGREPGG